MMANEKDVVQQRQNNDTSSTEPKVTVGVATENDTTALKTGDDGATTESEQKEDMEVSVLEEDENEDEEGDTTGACAHAKLNDLVADLCLNGETGRPSACFGDYTNIRATVDYVEGTSAQKPELSLDELTSAPTLSGTVQTVPVQPPSQNSSFSFKHFLNSGNTMTAPSTTITSLDPVVASTAGTVEPNTATPAATTNPTQTSTGARPKVPHSNQQSSSASNTSLTSMIGGFFVSGSQESTFKTATRMKRSPRFSSFDSQASLAEFVGPESGVEGASGRNKTEFFLFSDTAASGNSDFFPSDPKGAKAEAINYSAYDRQYVPRSHSNYDMPAQSASPRHRVVFGSTKEARPTRLALNVNASKLKLDLPLENAASVAAATARSQLNNNNGGDFPPAPAAASALPDFVQDHWIDAWYANEMYLNSPSNSPVCDFGEDLTVPAVGNSAGGVCTATPAAVTAVAGNVQNNLPGVVGSTSETTVGSKMLPDFLSDGPIIHSSQRLADVTAGLPSNVFGSPGDPPMATQASHLRIENERLERELTEARTALNEQTRRASELERQLEGRKRNDTTFNRNVEDENLEKSKRSSAATVNITKLKQQVLHLTAEVETLRRENELLREEGAVGGCSTSNINRAYGTAATSARIRPSRTQQLSRDLLRAASNAENNLRQLLAGVENLRQMAADIDHSETVQNFDESPDMFSDFLGDCADYEEYQGGPAL